MVLELLSLELPRFGIKLIAKKYGFVLILCQTLEKDVRTAYIHIFISHILSRRLYKIITCCDLFKNEHQ